MTRDSVEGMIRTGLTTHHAKHGVMLPAVDEFIERLADAIETQQKREADAKFGETLKTTNAAFAANVDG